MPARRSPTCCQSSSMPRRAISSRRSRASRCSRPAPVRRRRSPKSPTTKKHRRRSGPFSTARADSTRSIASTRSSRVRRRCLSGIDEQRRERPVLTFQRYGRGKAFALTLQDSWLWQMHALDLGRRYDARTLLASVAALAGRWRAGSGRGAVHHRSRRANRSRDARAPTIVDPTFVELNDASVVAHVTSPDGSVVDVPMQWSGERSGEYSATVPTRAQGWYEAQDRSHARRQDRSARR